MREDLASANVNRSYALAATSISIFTFVLFFLYPRFASGEADAALFQATLVVMGLTTFSFAFASFCYYGAALGDRFADVERARYARRGDCCWLFGCVLLFLAPTLVLLSIGLVAVALAWLALWLGYVLFMIRSFPRVQMAWKQQENG